MKAPALLVALILLVAAGSPAGAQTAPDEGYVQSLRSLYKQPDASSETVGLLHPGDYVRIEHVHALVYRVYRDDAREIAGYVVYPKIGPESPLVDTPVQVTTDVAGDTENGSGSDAASARRMWVHTFVNIRVGPSTRDDVVAQLPPGSSVMVAGASGRWHQVFKPDETVFEQARALGFVHESLLKTTEPPREVSPLAVGQTRGEAATPTAEQSADPELMPSDERGGGRSVDMINVNTASSTELEALPRIGPVIAQRIVDYRTQNGAFREVDDLVKVKGIGEKTLERLRPYVGVN